MGERQFSYPLSYLSFILQVNENSCVRCISRPNISAGKSKLQAASEQKNQGATTKSIVSNLQH